MRFAHLVIASGLIVSSAGACGGESRPPAVPSVPPAPSTAPSGEADASTPDHTSAGKADTAALARLTVQESKSGTCDADHQAALEKLLDDIEANVRAKTEDGKPLTIESFTKRTLALSDTPRGVQLTLSGKGTQVHVMAFSPNEVSLDVLAGNQAATTMRSQYKADVTNGPAQITLPKLGGVVPLEADSRQIEMKPGTPLDVKMRGQGCAAVVVFSKS